jgi:V/A-type H+-transporting ATPase subunit A
MVPFNLFGNYRLVSVAPKGKYRIDDKIAEIEDEAGNRKSLTMSFYWPVKRPIDCYEQRERPHEPLVTKIRLIDTFFPVAKGGTYCIPGPFGAGKTVLQQATSRYAEADIVIVAACGERAGEVVETIKEFPELIDPKTGKTLMERTVIVCNTSSMPVAAREASVYTAVTMAEYYRQMGLDVLLLADSTSRWAQAMREMSGRLEEIPGEEAFPAYLESVIAAFYERAGRVRLRNGEYGSVTIGGTVSPAGGNFDEPVTQSTLKVVGAFHGLSRERSDARKYPAIHPLESWSKYEGVVDPGKTRRVRNLLHRGNEVEQMMKVVGEEGTSIDDFVIYLKSELVDNVYIQQNSFDPRTAAVSPERQQHLMEVILEVLDYPFHFKDKEDARRMFNRLRLKFTDYNQADWMGEEFKQIERDIISILTESKKETGEDNEKDIQ